jgi:hypothetical protein
MYSHIISLQSISGGKLLGLDPSEVKRPHVFDIGYPLRLVDIADLIICLTSRVKSALG